jgi:Calcineurin-like phosphoesterase/Purple acid Phosphatase, N-terminal domain
MQTSIALTTVGLLLCCSAPASGQKLIRGPYLQWVTTTSIYVVWDQDKASAAEVRYGLISTALTQSATSPSGAHHEVKLTGLLPGKTYHYVIYQGGKKLPQTASTLPTAVKGAAPFKFLLFGDTRSDFVTHQKQIFAMANEPDVRLFFNTGDLVASGDHQPDWNNFFKAEDTLIRRVPLFPVLGNHDEDDGKFPLYAQHMVLKGASPAPEAYYAFTYGNARFIVLDSHVNVDPWYLCVLAGKLYDACFKPAQLNWLKKELQGASAAPGIQHTFVLIHMGPYSSKQNRSGYAQLRDLLPLFKTYGVRAIFSGHDHYYERGISGNGIPYVITGGGGAGLYAVGLPSPQPHTVIKNQSIYHYNVIAINGPQVSVTVKSLAGKVIDQYTLGTPAPDGGVAPSDGGPPLDLTTDSAGTADVAVDLKALMDTAKTDTAKTDTAKTDTAAADSADQAGSGEAGCCRISGRAGASPGPLSIAFIVCVLLLWSRRRG